MTVGTGNRVAMTCESGRIAASNAWMAVVPCVVVLLVFVSGRVATAVEWPKVDDDKVRIWISIARHPALGQALARRIEERVARKAASALGGLAPEVSSAPAIAQTWLHQHELDELTADHMRRWHNAASGKTIVVDIRYERGSWRLAGIEYDAYFATLGDVRRCEVVQRELVAEIAAEWPWRCYSPIGRIVRQEGDLWIIECPLADRWLRQSRANSLEPGDVLRIFRERLQSSGSGELTIRQEPRDDQFLVVAEVRPGEIAARLSLPGQAADEAYFAPLRDTDPQARFFVHPVRPRGGACEVRVVTEPAVAADPVGKATPSDAARLRTPREGCAVYLTTIRPSRGDLPSALGTTNDRGEFVVDAPAGLSYVVVVYGAAMYFRPYVPGASPRQLEFTVPFRAPRLDLLESLTRIGDNLRDRRARFSDQLKQMKETVKNADIVATQRLVEQGLKTADIAALRVELDQVKKEATTAAFEVEPTHGELVEELKKYEKEIADSDIHTAVVQAEVEGLRRRINDLWPKKLAWDELQPKLNRLVELDKSDMLALKRRNWLNDGLRVESDEQVQARKAVDDAVAINSFEQFIQSWPGLRSSLEQLIKREDLWLLRVNEMYGKWNDLAVMEQKKLNAAIDNFDVTDRGNEKERLEKQLAQLTDVAGELGKIDASLQQAIESMRKKAPF